MSTIANILVAPYILFWWLADVVVPGWPAKHPYYECYPI